ncbi:MAG TPA: bifunctional isocitrate dehydrogenase kinase/phosphatase [Polyangiaceae bacterium]|nr:bifunctional isocitrate dehydrogenase kinase/phosphatase [Polyangiaceae bacterium]
MASPSQPPVDFAAIARLILGGFDKHYRIFRAISAGAKDRFERADWAAVQRARIERIDMYDQRVREAVAALAERHPEAMREAIWPDIKQAYIALLLNHQRPELAETFFNSVACRVLSRTYYNNRHIFWRPAVSTEHIESLQKTYRSYYPARDGLQATMRTMVADFGLVKDWEDLDRDVAAVIDAMSRVLPRPAEAHPDVQVQALSSLFYRNQAAYLIGRVIDGHDRTPFAVPIRQNSRGELYLDALLLHRAELGALFSLARAYFMVDMEVPSAFVEFLKTIFPDKPTAELYIALGLQKQGKTLFFRKMVDHLKHSSDRFVAAPGVPGMVMVVFTLPSFPYVFKVIRDRFEAPKDVDRAQVEAQYRFVKLHDRVGRMADTLEFRDVALPLARFSAAMLKELEEKAPRMLERTSDQLVIKHLYVERRLTPLDIHLAHAKDEAQVREGLRDYGNCLRELAYAAIFPGDMLLKNFGITRYGRVVFYDYDEIAELSTIHFRRMPSPTTDEEVLAQEPWFYVGPFDVFPEELPTFVFPQARWRQIFEEEHPALFTADFWLEMQRRVAAGEQIPFYPYPPARRFPHPHA